MSKMAKWTYGISTWGVECVVDSMICACWELVNRYMSISWTC